MPQLQLQLQYYVLSGMSNLTNCLVLLWHLFVIYLLLRTCTRPGSRSVMVVGPLLWNNLPVPLHCVILNLPPLISVPVAEGTPVLPESAMTNDRCCSSALYVLLLTYLLI